MGLDAHVTGIDLGQGMLDVGIEKIKSRGYQDKISMQQGILKTYPLTTIASTHILLGLEEVRNFENLNKGLSEMHRVLKSGGITIILEFSKPKIFPIKQLFGFYFKCIMPTFGKLLSKDSSAYTYLPESVMAFPEGDDFLNEMGKVGFNNLRQKKLTGGIASIYIGYK